MGGRGAVLRKVSMVARHENKTSGHEHSISPRNQLHLLYQRQGCLGCAVKIVRVCYKGDHFRQGLFASVSQPLALHVDLSDKARGCEQGHQHCQSLPRHVGFCAATEPAQNYSDGQSPKDRRCDAFSR